MRNFLVKVFNEYVVGTTNIYTPTHLGELLGSADRLCGIAVVHALLGTSPTLTLQFEHSFDGTRWQNQNVTPELNAWNMANRIEVFVSTKIPTLNFVRLRAALAGTSPSATIEVWLCGRSPNQ
jgi:hypothetical protein